MSTNMLSSDIVFRKNGMEIFAIYFDETNIIFTIKANSHTLPYIDQTDS